MIATEQKNNGVKFLAMIAVFAMVVTGAAVVMSDNGADAANDDDSQIYGGMTLSTTQNFTGASIRVVEDLIVTSGGALNISGGNFTIESGVTVTIQNGGSITVDGGLVTVNGTLIITGSGSTFEIGDQAADEEYSIIINGTVTVARSGEMTQAADVTSTSKILINDGGILEITKRATDISSIEDMYVYMNVGATFDLNGNANNVTVQAIGTGSNATYGAVKIDACADDAFTKDDRSSSELTFTVTSQNKSALTDRNNDKSNVTLRQYIVNVDGTLANGDKMTTVEIAPVGATAFYDTTGYNYQISPIVSVTGTLEADNTASVEISADTQIDISGTVTFDYDETDAYNGTTSVYGSMYITGTMTAYYVKDESYSSFTVDNATGNYNRVVINGGSVSLTTNSTLIEFIAANNNARFYGSLYLIEGNNGADDTIYITDFDDAVASGTDEVFVFAFGAQNYATAQEAIDRGAFNITSDLTIPDGMTVWIWNALVVSEGSTLTLEEGAEVIIYQEDANNGIMTDRDNDGKLFVQGKVVDYYGAMEDYEGVPASSDTGVECDVFVYEVKKVTDTDTESYVTYTTLKIALDEAIAGEEIQLNGKVTISENMTVPADVTVSADSTESVGIEVQGATLTVDGVLDMNYTQFNLTTKTGSETVGNIVVNNYVVDVHNTNYNDDAWNMTMYLDGAYFNGIVGDAEIESNYISTVEIAADSSATVTDNIRIFGNVDMGDVEFTAADELVNGLTIYIYNDAKDVATAGTITINSNVYLNTNSGDLTGTIAGADATITVDANKDTTFTVVTVGADEQSTTQMQISSMVGNSGRVATSDGTITIASGTVYIIASFNTDSMTVAEGATLVITDTGALNADANPSYRFNTTSGNMPLLTESLASNLAGLTVNGTITVEGQISADVVYINGTVAITDTGSFTSNVLAYINGAVTSEEGVAANYVVALVNGTISGDVSAEFVAAFPGSDVSGADIVAPGTTGINSTNYYVNGEQIATVYAKNGVAGEIVLLLADVNGVKYDTSRFYIDSSMTDCVTDFNTSDGKAIYDTIYDVITGFRTITYDSASDSYDFTDFKAALVAVTGNFEVGSYENIYIGMEPADVTGTISVGTGLNLYIDSLSWSPNSGYQLGVGTHTVSFDVSTGYDGTNATITFNGQNIQNGGTIEITADMNSFTLVVSGAVPSSGGTVVVDNNDGGMGLTDILLIVLVVLIVIMAIIVALRLMRS